MNIANKFWCWFQNSICQLKLFLMIPLLSTIIHDSVPKYK